MKEFLCLFVESVWGCLIRGVVSGVWGVGLMAQGQVVTVRRLLRRRSFKSSAERDDRGWTLLHVGARKGDLKAVSGLCSVGFLQFFFWQLW